MTHTEHWDEGEPMTAVGLVSTTAFLLSCGVHPNDLGEAWAFARQIQHEAEHPSQMAPLVKQIQSYAREREIERDRAFRGVQAKHTGPVFLT